MPGISMTFPYFGGKTSKMSWLIPLLRPTGAKPKVFVDLCIGSGAVALSWSFTYNQNRRTNTIINDKSNQVYSFFKVLRDERQSERLVELLSLTPYSRKEFYDCIDAPPSDDPVENARRFYTIVCQSLMCIPNATKSTFSYTKYHRGKGRGFKNRVDRLPEIAEELRYFTLENRDAIELLDYHKEYDRALIYIDPPYLHSTRNSSMDYHEEPDEVWHTKLLESAVEAQCSVAISGYHSKLYKRILKGWYVHEKETYARAPGAETQGRTEVLFTNYEPASVAGSLF